MRVGFRFKFNFLDFGSQKCMLVWIDGKFYSKINSWNGMQNKLNTKLSIEKYTKFCENFVFCHISH